MLNLDSADTSTPGWFQLRTKASKNIIESMTEDEKKVLEDDADRMAVDGLPADVQRRYVPDNAEQLPVITDVMPSTCRSLPM